MDSGTATAKFYADFNGLTGLKKNVKANDPQAIREAARQFESLFTSMMLKSMREAKLGEGLGDSEQSDFYQDMYDQQLALQMSQGKGLGLADMLVQQLTRSGAIGGGKNSAGAAATGTTGVAASGGKSVASHPTHSTTGSQAGSKTGGVSDRQRISFIQRFAPYAQQAGAQLGVSADNLIAQAALETGWGRHLPTSAAGSSNNVFGVKAGTSWQGASTQGTTTEYRGAVASRDTQTFRAYSSLRQGVNDYVTLLSRRPGYQAALGTGDDTQAFASALQRGGYASDPDYVQKLVATAASVKALRSSASGDVALTTGSQASVRTADKVAGGTHVTKESADG